MSRAVGSFRAERFGYRSATAFRPRPLRPMTTPRFPLDDFGRTTQAVRGDAICSKALLGSKPW